MIHIVNDRFNGQQCDPIEFDRTVEKAFISLTKYELGFGGVVKTLTTNKIVVRTQVLGCTDTTTFTGSDDEMKTLVNAASWFIQLSDLMDKELISHAAGMLSGQSTLLLAHAGPILIGTGKARVAMILGSGFSVEEAVDIIKMSDNDIEALVGLKIQNPESNPLQLV